MSTTWAAVIGDPIAHSLSPVLHRKAYELLGLSWQYRRIRVGLASLPKFMAELPPECVGLSVTMPCKRAICSEVDAVESLAKTLRVANTVVAQGGLRAAFNTDVQGITEALRPFLNDSNASGRPVILGNGATACSALAALGGLGYRSVVIAARNLAGVGSAFALAGKLGIEAEGIPLHLEPQVAQAMSLAPIVISTIPHAVSEVFASVIEPAPGSLILDVTYSQGRSALALKYEVVGGVAVSPLSMLVHQGIAQVKLMTSYEVPYLPVFNAVQAAATSR